MTACALCNVPLTAAFLSFGDENGCGHMLCPGHAKTFLSVNEAPGATCPLCHVITDLTSTSSDEKDLQDLLRDQVKSLEKEEEALSHRMDAQKHAQRKLEDELSRLKKSIEAAGHKIEQVRFQKDCAKSVAGYNAVAEANVFLKDLSLSDTPLRARISAFHWFVKHALKLDVATVGAALKAFHHFLQHCELSEGDQQLEVWERAIQAHMTLIQASRPDTQFLQLSILSEISSFPILRDIVWRHDGLPLIVRMMSSINEYVKMEACACLKTMTYNPSTKETAVLSHNTLGPLYQMFRSANPYAQERGVSTIWHLAGSDAVKERIAREEGLSDFLPLLQSAHEPLVESVCIALGYLTRNDQNKVALRKVNGLGPLIGLLVHENPSIQGRAAGALWNCAADGENKVEIRKLGGIQPLLSLLYSDNPMVQENAAGAIWNLVVDQNNKLEILKYGGIEALVHQLQTSSLPVLENVTGTLWNCAASTEARAAIREVDAFPVLLGLLRESTSMTVRDNVAGTLRSCSVNDDNKPALREAGALEVFRDALVPGEEDSFLLKITSAVLLMSQEKGTKVSAHSIGLLPRLVDCLGPEVSVPVKEKVLGALRHLTTVPENKAALAKVSQSLERIARGLTSSDVSRGNAASTLWHCTRNEPTLKQTVGAIPNVMDSLVNMVASDAADLQESAAGALMSLAVDSVNKKAIGEAGGVPALVNLISIHSLTGNQYVLLNALAALKNLIAHNGENCAMAIQYNLHVILPPILMSELKAVFLGDLATKEACGCIKHMASFMSKNGRHDDLRRIGKDLVPELKQINQGGRKFPPTVLKAANAVLKILATEGTR